MLIKTAVREGGAQTLLPLLLLLLLLIVPFNNAAAASNSSAKQQTLQTQSDSYFNPKLPPKSLSASKKFEGSSDLVDLRYHMGPVLSSPINIYLIWYGRWAASHQLLIKDFLLSISTSDRRAAPSPSVSQWWRTVSLYTDQTGANISSSILITGEYSNPRCSQGTHSPASPCSRSSPPRSDRSPSPSTTRTASTSSLPPGTSLSRTSAGPFAASTTSPSCLWWATCCRTPGWATPGSSAPLNADDKLVGHELAELASNPLVNAWYTEEDPTAPTEIRDLCKGLYGTGARGGYIGQVMRDREERTYNVKGRRGQGSEVFGAMDLESYFEGLCRSECVGLGFPERQFPSSPLLSSRILAEE